jgi:prevent-host-death family protein
MIKINDDTILIGITSLRTEMPIILKEMKKKKVILTKRGKPVAVIEDYDEYQKKEKFLDEMEDIILGNIAKERLEKSKPGDFITHEELIKKLGIK